MKTRTNVFILSLAVADLLFIITILPFKAIDFAINDDWPFGTVWCKISGYVLKVTFYASVYTLLGVSFNRFLAVVFPISYDIQNPKKCHKNSAGPLDGHFARKHSNPIYK